jgi:hypothetical protein
MSFCGRGPILAWNAGFGGSRDSIRAHAHTNSETSPPISKDMPQGLSVNPLQCMLATVCGQTALTVLVYA